MKASKEVVEQLKAQLAAEKELRVAKVAEGIATSKDRMSGEIARAHVESCPLNLLATRLAVPCA